MMHHTPHPSSNNNDDAFDLSQIFIGREHQLALFNIYLDRWRRLIYDFKSDGDLVAAAPSPNNKIQGLVVLLYGRSGFGKTTLLRKYCDIALQENQNPLLSKITVSKVIDWEFAVEGKRSLFNPPQGKGIDAPEYFKVLCGQLAIALGKEPKEFKEYQKAVTALEETRKKAEGVLEGLRNDDRYDWLRGLAVEAIITAVGTYAPASKAVLDNPSVKKGVDAVAKLTQEQISRVLTKLHDKLGAKLNDYLDSALRLGLALGRDLAKFAKNFPLLIFFDTYEEIDEGDVLLRIIMGAAGLRVGWVIAGRNKLWTGLEQTEYSLDTEYGYKEIVPSDRGMAVDFNAGGVGAFTLSDINELFSQLCKKIQYEPPLPKLTRNGAKRILKVTLGIPLAVKIAAGLYMETADLDTVIEEVEGKRKVVDKMVHRYLIHTRIDQSERAKLYGLALLRRANQPAAVSAALDLTSEEAKTAYPATLSRLQRRYSFIFTEKEEPLLHQEVRHFLRLWLLQHYKEPHIQAINEHLKEAHEVALKKLEELRHYASLEERLQDDEWVGIYLDLAQQQFWIDPIEGMRYLLPFMIAAAIYYRTINEEARRLGQFFVKEMKHPYLSWWRWADKCLILPSNFDPIDEELVSLEQLTELASQHCLTFPSPIPDCRKELEAALWWRLGEAYEVINAYQALKWYEMALAHLGNEIRVPKFRPN